MNRTGGYTQSPHPISTNKVWNLKALRAEIGGVISRWDDMTRDDATWKRHVNDFRTRRTKNNGDEQLAVYEFTEGNPFAFRMFEDWVTTLINERQAIHWENEFAPLFQLQRPWIQGDLKREGASFHLFIY